MLTDLSKEKRGFGGKKKREDGGIASKNLMCNNWRILDFTKLFQVYTLEFEN